MALLDESKDEFHNLRQALLLWPNLVIAWVEVFACENYLQPIGGHVIYDLGYPLTSIIYFAIVVWHVKKAKKIK